MVRALPLEGWQLIELPEGLSTRRAMEWFRGRPEILAVEPNHRYQAHRVPDDSEYGRLYGMERIGAPAAWDITQGDASVVVAVLDTGMNLGHPDLAPNLWKNPEEVAGNGVDDDGNGWVDDIHGVDVVEGDGDPSDDAGHGTHVAGTIGAAGGNGKGVAGVAWQVRMMAVRVLSVDGSATTAEFVSAFDYVTRQRRRGVNVRVINCSWGGGFPSLALREAMEAAAAQGILLVCSAGNDHADTDALPTFPAGYDIPEIVVVGASTACDEPSGFSNHGRTTVDLAAPGSGILSTFRGGERYAVLSGTSMAAPHVSGAAALLFGVRPNGTVADIRALLLGTVDPVAAWEGKSVTGGRLNVGRAVQQAQANSIPAPVTEAAPANERMTAASRAPNGRWAGGRSFQPAISADGRWVAFVSAATNLVSGDKEGFLDIFLHDRNTDTVQRVSQTTAGVGGNGDSETPSVSADGRFVAYVSLASNLAGNDPNETKDVFLWDRNSRQTELISVRSDGRASGNGLSELAVINGDGSVVAFASDATDLVARDGNEVRDIFVRDRSRRVTERMSVDSKGVEAFDWSDAPAMSADGRIVAFHSVAWNLVDGDKNEKWDVFIRDRSAGKTELLGGAGVGDDDSLYPLVSGDGNWVVFSSAAAAFTGGPTNGKLLLVVHDRKGKGILRAGTLSDGAIPKADLYAFGISTDGRFVTFTSDDPELAPGGELGFYRTFLFDRLRDVHELMAVSDAGYLADDSSFYAPISGDGRRVAFVSNAFGLVPGDGNAVADVFVVDRGEAIPDLGARVAGVGKYFGAGVVHPMRHQRVGQTLAAGQVGEYEVALANAGVARSFVVRATTGVGVRGWDIRAKARVAGDSVDITTALTGAGWTTPTIAAGSNVVLSVTVNRAGGVDADVVFGPRIQAHATAEGPVLDAVSLVTATSVGPPGWNLVSRAADGSPAARTAEGSNISGDGNRVVFASESDHLEDRNDLNLQSDVFLVDRAEGTVRRLSDASATVAGNADSRYPSVSGDGSRVAFQSRADNLVPSDSNGVEDIFVKEMASGVTTRASVSSTGVQGNRGSEGAFLAGGGRYVAFTSFASNLVEGDGNGSQDVFVRDLESGTTECVSRSTAGGFGDADSEGGWLSADGRYVIFTSFAGNLGPTDRNNASDVYLWDRTSRTMELVSANTNGIAGNGTSGGGAISDDGRWATFHSYASDLAPGFSGAERQSYLLDRSTRVLRRVSDVVGAMPDGLEVRSAIVSPDGRWLGITGARGCGPGGSLSQAFAYEMLRARLDAVSVMRGGEWGDDHSYPVRFGAGGRHLAFESWARNLVLESSYPAGQVYVADLARPGVDALVKGSGGWRGDGVATSQTRPAVVVLAPVSGEGGGARFFLRVRNDGNTTDRFRIHAEAPAGSVLRVLFDGVEPLAAAIEGVPDTWETPPIPAGQTMDITITLGLPPGVTGDLDLPIRVESTTDGSRQDWIRVTAALDSDEDGMPDSWETRFFGGLGIAGIGTDGDGDGALDSVEWLMNTDPTRPGDALKLGIRGRETDGLVRLTWPSKAGILYRIERSAASDAGFVEVAMDPVVGDGKEITWVDPAPRVEGTGFYRLQVEAP